MLINLYKTKTPIAIITLPLLIAVLALQVFLVEIPTDSNVFSWESQFIEMIHQIPWLNFLLTTFIITLTALQLNNVVNNYGFYSKNSYLPGFIYTLLLFTFNAFYFSWTILVYALLSYGLGYLFKVNRQDCAKSPIFMASLLIGTAIALVPWLLPLFLLPIITLILFRSFIWRELFLVLLGFILPWFYYFAIYFIVEGNLIFAQDGIILAPRVFDLNWLLLAFYSGILFLILFSFWRFLIVMSGQLMRFKKRSKILFHFIWIALISTALNWYFYDVLLVASIIPIAIILSVQILYVRNLLIYNVLISSWFIIVLVLRIVDLV
tara:strand:+ start:219 stop:1184 length:966 start_codon:yes stop_codon:yes gene_type:complete